MVNLVFSEKGAFHGCPKEKDGPLGCKLRGRGQLPYEVGITTHFSVCDLKPGGRLFPTDRLIGKYYPSLRLNIEYIYRNHT